MPSISLLELQRFKVAVNDTTENVREKDEENKRIDSNKNSHRQNAPTCKLNTSTCTDKDLLDKNDCDKMSVLTTTGNNVNNDYDTSISCGNLSENPILRIKLDKHGRSDQTSKLNYGGRAASADFDSRSLSPELPARPLTRSTSKDRLLVHTSDRDPARSHPNLEIKKSPPAKPNRESLRRSKQDVRSNSHHTTPVHSVNRYSYPRVGQNGIDTKVSDRQHPPGIQQHDYEELPSDVKIVKPRTLSENTSSPHERSIRPFAFQSPLTSPAVPDRPKNPRQRQNPLYAGMHINPYGDPVLASGGMEGKKLSSRCLRCLIASVIIAVLFSILSIATIILLIFGYLQPIQDLSGKTNFEMNATHQLAAASSKLKLQNTTIFKLQTELQLLTNRTEYAEVKNVENLERTKISLIDAVKSLNITALKGPSSADVSKCVHKSFGIGSSSSQEETNSGEYFAEKNYVTTGVTCSSSPGYVAYLHTREQDAMDWNGDEDEAQRRTIYICRCRKIRGMITLSPGARVECTIHYWQCPVL